MWLTMSLNWKEFLFLLLFLIIPCQIMAATKPLFSGQPEFDELNPTVLESIIFQNTDPSHGTVYQYISKVVGTGQIYSRYQITRLSEQGQLTRYTTTEIPPDASVPEIVGNGIGYGGIVALAYEKLFAIKAKRDRWNDFYKKYEIISIDHIQGRLFPLKVGNQLTFNYTAWQKTKESKQLLNGKIKYAVLAHYAHYRLSHHAVPGGVYVIRMWRSTQYQPQLLPIYQYDFSTGLNWYVVAKYWVNGKLLGVYHLVNWK